MKSKCPPGVICVENITLFLLIFVFIAILCVSFAFSSGPKTTNEKIIIKENGIPQQPSIFTRYNYGYTNLPNDILLNPYTPPLKDDRYLVPNVTVIPPGAVPINVSTNVGAVDTNYRQMGILTPMNGSNKDGILPLMGRPLFTNRQKYQYFTTSNQHNNVKLPVSVKGRSGTNEYGVDEIYTGDTVYIEGINSSYRVTMYDDDTIKYIPYI